MAFQFALPRGERRLPLGAYNNILRFQFALPRGERLEVAVLDVIDAVVSIRAPAWGATEYRISCNQCRAVSIRAPAWGATFGVGVAVAIFGVSIRAPAWGATDGARIALALRGVSIRAPAWGATGDLDSLCLRDASFNSRSRVGSDAGQRD